jgi:predicted ArsR family transcriptional regulator
MEDIIWWLIAGTRGGINRARIINELNSRPYNANQLAKNLNLDYKTVRHHMDVLIKNNIVRSSGDGQYGTVYMLSNVMKDNFESFKEIWKVSEEEKDI